MGIDEVARFAARVSRVPVANDNVHLVAHQIVDEAANQIVIACRKSPIEDDILPINVTQFTHLFQEWTKIRRIDGTCPN